MPVIPGICTSLITQSVSLMRSDLRKASAEPNAAATYPRDRMKLAVARRKDSSSSTIAIIGTFDKMASPQRVWQVFCANSLCTEDQDYRSQGVMTLHQSIKFTATWVVGFPTHPPFARAPRRIWPPFSE